MSETDKAVVRRLVGDVMNAGLLDVIDGIYAPELTPATCEKLRKVRAVPLQPRGRW